MTGSKKSYQQLKTELENILHELQHEDTDIDKAVELHERGQKILKEIESYLDNLTGQTDIKIKKL